MKPYKRLMRCEKCGTQFTIVADRKEGGRPVSAFSVSCVTCRRAIHLEASCDVDEKTIQLVDVVTRSGR
jgi:hypothetical protein